MTKNAKPCIDCKFHHIGYQPSIYLCSHPLVTEPDPVIGERFVECSKARDPIYNATACGSGGNLFEPIFTIKDKTSWMKSWMKFV